MNIVLPVCRVGRVKKRLKNTAQVYTTQEGIEEIKNNPQVYTTREGTEEIKNNPQVYTTKGGIG